MDFKLELVGVPVSDVDRAKDFYVEQAGLSSTTTTRLPMTCASCS
jgi:catechol 2,3-dioxygenase-like lactoylglutathione lyase family enzyme